MALTIAQLIIRVLLLPIAWLLHILEDYDSYDPSERANRQASNEGEDRSPARPTNKARERTGDQ